MRKINILGIFGTMLGLVITQAAAASWEKPMICSAPWPTNFVVAYQPIYVDNSITYDFDNKSELLSRRGFSNQAVVSLYTIFPADLNLNLGGKVDQTIDLGHLLPLSGPIIANVDRSKNTILIQGHTLLPMDLLGTLSIDAKVTLTLNANADQATLDVVAVDGRASMTGARLNCKTLHPEDEYRP